MHVKYIKYWKIYMYSCYPLRFIKMDQIILKSLVLINIAIVVSSSNHVVTTKLGEIIGKTITLSSDIVANRDVHQYLGIPYAQAPVGERRFLKPEELTKFTAPFEAKSHGAICPQTTFGPTPVDMSEDCLFLNVYVPDQPPDQPSGHAVMIWIHGGGFISGAGSQYDGSVIAAYGNIIVVTINYRLNLFGFLSTGDKFAPGNAGLWDQRMALQWVNAHIASFGGDKERVTVAGGSAGAISTMLQGFMPGNNGLIQRIITQSGNIKTPIQNLEKNVSDEFKIIATNSGCLRNNTFDMLVCLRGKSVEELMSVMNQLGFFLTYGPIVDGDFLKINSLYISQLSESGPLAELEFLRSLDILTGFNAYEGVFFLPFFLQVQQIEDFTPSREEMSNEFVPNALKYLYKKQTFQNELAKLVEAQHTTWANPYDSNSIRLELAKIIGDVNYGVPAIEIARLHKLSTSSRNFMYHFIPLPSYRRQPMPSWTPGSTHADEVPFVFGDVDKLGVGEENAWELELLAKMITYWTNFVKSGDPNGPTTISPNWPEYNLATGDYLKLEKTMSNSSVGQHFYDEEANFWLHVFPNLANALSKKDANCDHDGYTNAADTNCFVMLTLSVSAIYVFFMFPLRRIL